MTNFEDVGKFHERFNLPRVREDRPGDPELRPQPRGWDDDLLEFRIKFMQEELDEFKEAVEQRDHAKAFDALLDLAYVDLGTAHLLGYPWQRGWEAVQRANLRKVRAAKDGSDSLRGSAWDVVKPPGWQPPNIAAILRLYGFQP